MANITHLQTKVDPTDSNTYLTDSLPIAANQLVCAFFAWGQTSPGTASLSGDGIIWVSKNDTGGGTRHITFFAGLSSSAVPGVLTFTVAGGTGTPSRGAFTIFQIAQVNTNGTASVVQSNVGGSNSANNLTVNLGAFANPINMTIGALMLDTGGTITPGTGFTQIGQANDAGDAFSIQSQFKYTNDQTVDWTTSDTAELRAIAAEIAVIPQGGIFASLV